MRALVGIIGGGALIGVGVLLSDPTQEAFPHAEHAGLFPACLGCHAGAQAGDPTRMYTVAAADCATCHDGADLEPVDWREPPPTATNLDFSHGEHAAVVRSRGDEPIACEGCHSREARMAVELAVVGSCIACHAPEAGGHLAEGVDCATCHVPVSAAVDLSAERIRGFPQPPDHGRTDFLLTHGEAAERRTADCAICHSRESCARCHLNADRLAPIAGLSPDPRVARVVADVPGEWPEPPSHDRPDWGWNHGDFAEASIENCATCHARPSCAACHSEGTLRVVDRLPEVVPDGPRGVLLADVRPAGHTLDFIVNHGTAASLGSPDCAACHTERQCADCHEAAERPRFHPPSFVLTHGPEAFGNEIECAACHSTEAFCRDCHTATGMAAGGRTGGAFHDAVPDWILAHGAAARQGLEACATCHAQSTCLRCHSAKSGFRINPHGPGFDAEAMADRSTQSCAICHFEIPAAP